MPPIGPQRKRLFEERLIGQRVADHHAWWWRPLVIELADEGFENRLRRFAAAMVGIVRPVAVVAARPKEKYLYARRAAGCGEAAGG